MNEEVYKVKLPEFEGPLDLLLHLIKKNEMDIFNIQISKITEEYLKYIEMMGSVDLDVAGEFIVMAATLIYIKSKMLLPKEEGEIDEEDPRTDLVNRLLEYKRFKELSGNFGVLETKQREFFSKDPEDIEESTEYVEATLFDLLRAFQKIVAFLPKDEIREIDRAEFDVAQKINEILDNLEQNKEFSLNEYVSQKNRVLEIIAVFLAVLELVKMKLIKIFQSKLFDDIKIMGTEETGTEVINNNA